MASRGIAWDSRGIAPLLPAARRILCQSFRAHSRRRFGGAWGLEYRRSIGLTQRAGQVQRHGNAEMEVKRIHAQMTSQRESLFTQARRGFTLPTHTLSLSLSNMEIHSSLACVLSFKCSCCARPFGFEEALLHVPLQLLQPGQTHPQQMQMNVFLHACSGVSIMIIGKYTLFLSVSGNLAAYCTFSFCVPGNYDHYRNRPALSQDLIRQSETVDHVCTVDLSTTSLFNPSLKSLKSDRLGDSLYKH